MCIERNRDILFGVRAKSRALRYVPNCRDMQVVLPNPTTLAIRATAGLVHFPLSPQDSEIDLWNLAFLGSKVATLRHARS